MTDRLEIKEEVKILGILERTGTILIRSLKERHKKDPENYQVYQATINFYSAIMDLSECVNIDIEKNLDEL